MTTLEILALNNIAGYGPATVVKVVDLAKDSEVSSAEELLELVNAYESSKKKPKFKTIEEIKRALLKAGNLLKKCEAKGIRTVSFIEEDFPKNLFYTINENGTIGVPSVIYYKGDLSIARKKSIAIFGGQKPSDKAKKLSHYYGKLFAEAGFNIVNGLLFGCDSMALEGAMEVGSGNTIAILNHSLEIFRSDENARLAERILDQGGLLLSKFALGKRTTPCTFAVSNRILAAMADAVLVIQAGSSDAALYTATTALCLRKPVFCIKYEKGENDYRTIGNVTLMIEGAKYLDANDPVQQVTEAINKSHFTK